MEDGVAARARAWHHAAHAAVCDVLEPWGHGTIVRATRYPGCFDFNVVRVEEDPAMSVDALAGFADEALAGLAHRRVDFELIAAAEPLRTGFEAKGWKAMRVLWMCHGAAPPPGPIAPAEEISYDAVHELRVAWHLNDFPDQDALKDVAEEREIAQRRDVQVVAVRKGGTLVAFAQLERDGAAAEISQVYVHPEHRGVGHGTAVTRAAMEAAQGVRDLWIVADDDERAKQLYERLGFRPVWTTMEFLRLP